MAGSPDYRSIVVAYDETPGGRAALGRAAAIARGSGAGLTLAMAVEAGERDEQGVRASGRAALDAAAETLGPGLEPDTWLVATPAAPALLAVARDVGADLLVTGSRGRGRVARALLGSVSRQLVDEADCDVLIVHPADDEG